MSEPNEPRRRKSILGWAVLAGTAVGAGLGAVLPRPPDLTIVSGAVYGFVVGAIVGVVVDRRRGRG